MSKTMTLADWAEIDAKIQAVKPANVCTARLAKIAREIEKLALHASALESNRDWPSAGSLGHILETLQSLNSPK